MRLPIFDHEQEIVEAVKNHRVVVVEGPAGTGKTTQMPTMLRRAGLAPRLIGITQPRRIAAVSVAWRIAEELNEPIGEEVGYAIRFDDATSPRTRIKVMTDGILLQEARGDADLRAYDIVMVDEAHERSLNIDFALGLLHQVLQRRHDLRVVISSATLHPGHFQRFFRAIEREVPIISVKNRTFPVDVRHAPLESGAPNHVVRSIVDHVSDLHRAGGKGHMLVFLPGEGLINKTEQELTARKLQGLRIMPLYGRLTREEQERVFENFPGQRKVILSTNLAETSITIEGVDTVIDSGLAKLPWFNAHTGVNTLREEPISQASAIQRAGRAGRTGPGTVIRLYDAQSFNQRPEFTPEEILRVDLSEAVLRLIDLGVRDVENFPFPTSPPRRKLEAALDTLMSMGAIDQDRNLTQVGRQMVPFPLSPPLARMVVEAANRFPNAVSDVLLVGAFLSVRSPFMFPPGEEDQARAAQARLAHELGDAMTSVTTYYKWQAATDKPAFCKRNYLDADTMSFIHKAHQQLGDIAQEHGVVLHAKPGEPEEIVRCVATGFAERVLMRRGHIYTTLSDLNVAIHPSSSLYGSDYRFVVAAELMSSGRTYAFNASAIKAEWLGEVNPRAARQWQVRTPKPAARDARPEIPAFLQLGSHKLPVAQKGRKPTVDVPLHAVGELMGLGAKALPAGTQRYKARVISHFGVLQRGSLGDLFRMMPLLPWPTDESRSPHVPLGVLLEPDRNLHTLQRHLQHALVPMMGPQMPQTGWLALVSNGGGGYWYDVIADFPEALGATLAALDDLAEAGPEAAPVADDVARLTARLLELADKLEEALAGSAG